MGDEIQAPSGVTLSQEQFQTLQKGALLLQKLSQGPTKRGFERLIKEIIPEVETTDDIVNEAAAPYVQELKETKDQLAAFLASQQERDTKDAEARANADLSARFAALRSEGLTEAGEAEVRKLMIERNIADPAAAFALFERNQPKSPDAIASWEPDSWNYDTNAVERDVGELFKNPDRWADQEVGNVLADLRRPNQL
jgi:hypothetical protein